MTTWVAFLRGVNVGGNNILPMKELRTLLAGLGLENVKTYIQSGNCVFDTEDGDKASLSQAIAGAILSEFGFEPLVMLMTAADLRRAVDANPYPQGLDDPKSVQLFFLSEPARSADIEALDDLKGASEVYTITDKVFYLYAPDGIGRSKLAVQAEKKLGVATTTRNLRSAMKILKLAS